MSIPAADGFSPEFYQKQLASLTINSRAVITELTSIAEHNVDHCNEICEMIEARIKKCLPHHKLNSIYLLDSICKNVGNPYNVIFGKNLYKTFAETYSIVTDTPTRQHLINLFKTWVNAKTNTGSELFPAPILAKIENFIIQATSINGQTPPPSTSSAAPVSFSAKPRIGPDWLMKEGRNLLLFIIKLNQNADKIAHAVTNDEQKALDEADARRNTLVSMINETLDGIMFDMRGSEGEVTPTIMFEANSKKYYANYQVIRNELEDQDIKQEKLIKEVEHREKIASQKKEQRLKNQTKKDRLREYLASNKVVINPAPNMVFFTNISQDIRSNESILAFVQAWGKTPKPKEDLLKEDTEEKKEANDKEDKKEEDKEDKKEETIDEKKTNADDLNSIGFNFSNSILNPLLKYPVIPNKPEFGQKPKDTSVASPPAPPAAHTPPPSLPPKPPVVANAVDVAKDDSDLPFRSNQTYEEEDDDDDDYDPSPPNEVVDAEDEADYVPTLEEPVNPEPEYTRTGTGIIKPKTLGERRSILKRRAVDPDGPRVPKRVRFDI